MVEYENKLKELLRLLNNKDFKDPNVKLLDDGTSFKEARSEIQKLIDDEGNLIKKSLETKYISPNITEVTACYREQDGQIRKVAFSYNELTGAITKTNKASQDAATTSKFDTFGDKLKKKFGDLGTYLASFASFYEIINVIKQGFNVIKELDTQLTEMQKVSNESLSNLQAYAKNSFDIASQIGSTGAELQASTADYMRLGKSLQDASELAKTTNVLMNVSEFESIDKATESMISMTQAYQELDSMDIVDKLNLTGNNYSISTDELAQSLQKSSSALKTAKNDFDEAIALTVAGNSVVQDPDSVAAGIRTIALRMTGTDTAKKELEDMGEEADNVLTKSKLNDTLEMLTNIDSRGGISLLDDNGNYRSTAKVLMDLAERWQDIGEQDVKDGQNRQNALLEALAGKNRSNILASILNDPNLLKDVYNDVSTNYQGSAMKENEKQMESIEGHLKQLQNTWQEFWASDNNREFITDILDLANGFLELANAIGGAKTVLIAFFAAFASFKWKDELSSISKKIMSIGSEIIETGDSTALSGMLGNLNKNITKSLGKAKNLVKNSTAKAIKEGAEEGGKIGSVQAANGGLMNIANFLFTTPVGLAITAVGSALIAKSMYDSYKKGLEEASDKVENTLNSHKSKVTDLNKFKESIPELSKEYDSLKEGVSSTGENLSLTNDEFQRYHEITSQIASTCPNLISGYDSTGNAIINLKNSVEELNSAYDEASRKEAIAAFKEMNFDDVDKSIKNNSIDTNKYYKQFLKDSKTTGFSSKKNKKYEKEIRSEYYDFVKSNFSNDKELLDSSKGLTNSNVGGDQIGSIDNEILKKSAEALAFNQEEYDATIEFYEQLASSTEDENKKNLYNAKISYYQNAVSGYRDEISQMKDAMTTYVQKSNKYYDLDMNQRSLFDSLIQNLSKEDYYNYKGEKVNNLFNQYYEYMKSANSSSDMSTLSNWETLLTGSNGTIAENESKIQNAKNNIIEGLGVTEETINDVYKIDTTVLDKEKEKLVKFYSDINSEAEKSEDETNNNIVKNYKHAAEQKEKIIKGINENLSGKELINITDNLDNINTDEVLNLYETQFKKFYNNRDEFISDYVNSLKDIEPTYVGENKSFDQLESNISNYSSTLAQLNTLGNDNVNINTDLADSLLSMGDGFSEYVEKSEDGTTATIKNIEAVKELIKNKQQEGVMDARNSKNEAIQSYQETTDTLVNLTDQLERTADSEGHLDESILKNIQSTQSQINTIKRNIEYYEQLETKILGATNAFDEYSLAVQQDESQNTFSNASSMLDTLKSGFETSMMGTASFDAALQGLLSDSKYNEIMNTEDIDTRVQKMKSSYDELKSYFKKDSNGNPALSGVENFVNKGYSKGLFDSKNIEKFDIKGNTNIDDFVDEMNLSKEAVYSMFETIEKFNMDKDNSIFDKLMANSDGFTKTNYEIKQTTNELEKQVKVKNDLLVQRSKIDKSKEPEKWEKLTNKINKCSKAIDTQQAKQKKLNNENVNNVEEYIKVQNEIEKTQSKADIYRKKIEKLKNDKKKGKNVSDEEIKEVKLKSDEAEQKLDSLIKRKNELGKPVKVDLELTKEKLESEIDKLKKDKIKLEAEVTTTGFFTGSAPTTPADRINALYNNPKYKEINKKIKDKQTTLQQINVILGIDAQTTGEYDKAVAKITADKKELGKDVDFDIKANGTNTVISQLSGIKNYNIPDKDITTTHTIIENKITQENGKTTSTKIKKKGSKKKNSKPTNSAYPDNPEEFLKEQENRYVRAFGQNNSKSVFDYFGNAFANGNLNNMSSYTSGKTLVGELGAETLVDPYAGTYRVVGIHGAEFVNIPKDAIVFNHQQTKELQQSGKIKSRGAIVSNASGFMQGFAKVSPYGNAYAKIYSNRKKPSSSKKSSSKKSSSKKSSSKSKSNSSSSEAKGLIDDVFDWIEIRLERLSNKTQRYITLAENAISKTVKELGYKYAISTTKTEITNNQAGYKKYASYANALIKKAKKNGVTNASKYAKKVRDGSIDLQKITNEKTLDFVNSYQQMYEKAKECDSAVLSLTAQLSDLAESLYNLPTEYAEKSIEKFSDKIDVLSAKIDYSQTYVGKNSALAEQNKYQLSIKKAYENAKKSTIKNYNSAKGKINSTKDSALKGLTSKQKKSIVSSVKANKEIHISPKYSATLQSAIANYNKALEANRIACNNANKALYEYNTTIRQNTNAMYENIASYYENKRSLNDSKKSTFESQLAYRESMGYSAISESQKGVFTNQIDLERKNLDLINKELSKFNEATLRKQQKEGKLSEEDLNNQLAHIEELKSSRYETITTINDLNSKLKEINITRLDYIIDDISRAIEKFKNIISIKEARGDKITEDLYISQMKSNENKIPNLLEKYKQFEEEQKFYAVTSQKYQDLEKQKDDIISEAVNIVVENEQLTDAVHELRFKKANEANNALETTIEDIEHLKDLLSDDELIDDSGKFTKSGLANIMLIGRELQTSRKKIANYRYMLEKLNESYKNGNLSLDEYNEQSRQYVEGIQNAVKDVEDYKDALVDLYKQQLEKENELLDKNIEKRKEALSNKKSYYDFDKTIKNANKDINLLKNQIAALEGVGNAAAKAEVERLKSQLSEAEENLEDTKYEHMVELKLTGYDEMQKSADEVLQNLLEDITTNADMQEQVVSSMLNNIVKNYDEAYGKIQETINKTAINGETSNSLTDSIYKLSDTLTRGFDLIRTTGKIDSSTIYESGIYSGNSEKPKAVDNLLNRNLSGSGKRQVASITPNKKSVNIKVGNSATIKFDILPSDANKSVIGTSSDTKVATVTSGTSIRITGKKAGTCSVTATPVDGGKTATISVTVQDKVVKPSKKGGNKSSGGGSKGGNKSSGGGSKGGNKSSGGGNKPKTSSTLGYISNLSGTISSKSSSTNIKKVQNALNKLGIKGKNGKALTVDGKWGTNTDYAVRTFQRSSKWGGAITADGIIGTKTKAKFRKAGYYKGGIVDNVMSLNNQEFLNMLRMNKDDGLITAKLGEGVIPKNIMPNFTQQLEKFNSLPADKILNNINNTTPNLEINIDKFMDVHGNVDKNCVNDLRQLQNDITNNITSTLTKEFRKLGYK